MGETILPDLGADILIPLRAVIGIAFSLIQLMYVLQVKLSPGSLSHPRNSAGGSSRRCQAGNTSLHAAWELELV
ncbi:hypothetical protein C1H46_039153 [Malus baccata]|uniref:Uncharacterized protein n=1 Tax=Malus baccata TaxID=106549 RepID=A0A540KM56_MALBA|nr:hypothetical protein C1H46_039153 [Malus baccata]